MVVVDNADDATVMFDSDLRGGDLVALGFIPSRFHFGGALLGQPCVKTRGVVEQCVENSPASKAPTACGPC
jgi:hypothetical protein